MRIRSARMGAALAALLFSSACATMPTSGPVETSSASPDAEASPGINYDPLPPQPGESPTEIVGHFLEAMKANPITSTVAQEFLTEGAKQSWVPEKRLITYSDPGDAVGVQQIVLPLEDINVYDDRGAWQRSGSEIELEFSLAKEDGEWRIDGVPDALIVPEWWFEEQYERVSLYFFDPSAQILVPEPVFVPRGDQFASALVRGLLSPPAEGDSRVARTFFAPGLSHGLSVPIRPAGIAEVALTGDPSLIDDLTAQRMLAQLVWTLRQEPRIKAVRLSVGDRVFSTSDGATQIQLDVGSGYDPTGPDSTTDLFALREGKLVRGSISDLRAVSGPLGQEALGVKEVGVSMDGTQAAAVGIDGSTVVLAPVDQNGVRPQEVVSGGRNLTVPVWDFANRAWTLDRPSGGARVLLISEGKVREVSAPGISGQRVEHFLVSRDGSRLVAVVRKGKKYDIRVARVQHSESGRVLGVRPAASVDFAAEGEGRIHDIAWRSPTAISVLSEITDDLAQIRAVAVEGAPAEVIASGSTLVRGRPRALISMPIEGTPSYALGGRKLTDLSTPERMLAPVPENLTGLTYSG